METTTTIDLQFDLRQDLPAIEEHNRRRQPHSTTWIHTEITPMPYEGRIGAPVTWLLANPGFDPAKPEFNEPPPITPGWPLQSLAPQFRTGYGKWTYDRVSELIAEFGAEVVANNLLVVQLCPWASASFHEGLALPSRDLARRIVLHQIEAGAVFVLVRSRNAWMNLVPELQSGTVLYTAHPLAAYLSRGNLRAGWETVLAAMRAARSCG